MLASRSREATRQACSSPNSAWAASVTSRTPRCRSTANSGRACRSGPTIPAVAAWRRSTPGGPSIPEGSSRWARARCARSARVEKELFAKLGYAEEGARGVLVLEGRTPADRCGRGVGRAEGGRAAAPAHVRRRADGEPRRRRADRRARDRDRPAQDGDARLRRDPRRERDGDGAARRRRPRATCGRSAAPTTASSTAVRRATPCAQTTTSWQALAARLPASASSDYGTPFYDIFKRYDSDFYKIDPMLFSPAEVWLTSAASGRTFHAGRVNADVLRASLFES